jgi:hypothetical protein
VRFPRRSVGSTWMTVLAVLLTSALLLPPASGISFGKFNDELLRYLGGTQPAGFEIAPMVTKGSSTPGPWRTVTEDIFNGIIANTGIIPCFTDPTTMRGRPGVLEIVRDSLVLNKGSRSTMGWFVRARAGLAEPLTLSEDQTRVILHNLPGPEYFVLMSYDSAPDRVSIDAGKDPQLSRLCAYEVFLFGPVKRPKSGESFAPWAPLVDGTAVNMDGDMLAGVPLEIASITNFLTDYRGFDGVTSGVNAAGLGCRVCHGETDQDPPESTLPFPWLGAPETSLSGE